MTSITYKILAACAVFGFFFVFIVSVPERTHAATVPSCSIAQADIDAIHAIQADPTLSYSAELTQELAARKALLGRVMACAQTEIQVLRQNLRTVSPADNAARSIQSGLSGQLDDAANYYGIERGKVTDAGVGASEQIAKDILVWRVSNLLPLEARIDDFVMWSRNQALFGAAAVRMADAGRVVSFLASTGNTELASSYAAAQASFKQAQDENAAAETALAQSQAADQVALLVQQSLQSLAGAYRSLSAVGAIVQGLVPQGQ